MPAFYSGSQEYGKQKLVTVRAHLREVKLAFGKSIGTREVMVKQHQKQMNLPERSFLRSSMRDMAPLKAFIEGAVAGILDATL